MLWLFLLVIGCSDDEIHTRNYPLIDTKPVTEINSNGATFNANVLNMGTSEILDHGFVYSSYSSPVFENADKISLGSKGSIGPFSAIGYRAMIKDAKYYVRAYAISIDNIVVYGQTIPFISLGSIPPTITDVNPTSGSIGDTITITGTGFSDFKINHRVFIGSVEASVIQSSEQLLKVKIPSEALAGEREVSLFMGQHVVIADDKFIVH